MKISDFYCVFTKHLEKCKELAWENNWACVDESIMNTSRRTFCYQEHFYLLEHLCRLHGIDFPSLILIVFKRRHKLELITRDWENFMSSMEDLTDIEVPLLKYFTDDTLSCIS